jgi:dihydrofolate reductase
VSRKISGKGKTKKYNNRMRKLKLYIACSLNGKIAAKNGSVDWLETIPNPEKSDYGYPDFQQTIDTTIQGYRTYKQIIDWGIDFPYMDSKNYVFTNNKTHQNTEYVEFVSTNHIEFVKKLKQQTGKDIWLIGGGQINTILLNSGLIDEIQVFMMPIILSEGIELFEALPKQTLLMLKGSKTYSSGVVELNYTS